MLLTVTWREGGKARCYVTLLPSSAHRSFIYYLIFSTVIVCLFTKNRGGEVCDLSHNTLGIFFQNVTKRYMWGRVKEGLKNIT